MSAERLKILFSSAKMATATFSSRILGLVRELAIASIFGASGFTDAFLVAYRIPNILRDLFAEGAFSSAFVPVFTEEKIKGEQHSKSLFWSLFLLLTLITGIIVAGIIVFAPEITHLFAPSFEKDVQKFNLTVMLIRVMAPFLTLVSLAALFMGALNSLKVFFIPSFAPACFNVVMILSIIFLPPYFMKFGGGGILAIGVGVLGGGFIQMLVQVPLLLKKKYHPQGPIKFNSAPIKKIFHRLGIGTIGIAATQINILITTILATGTVVGAVSWLSYAFRLFQFPVGVFSVSIAGSNLVHFSDSWKRGEKESAIRSLQSSYIFSLLIILPSMALLYSLSKETVHLILERGAFSSRDTAMTAMAVKLYAIGLPFYGLYKIFGPVFFALDKPKIPVTISIVSILANVIFCLLLTPKYGFQILALGTSLSMVLNSVLQGFYIKKHLDLDFSFFFNLKVSKYLLGSVLVLISMNYLTPIWFKFDQSFSMKFITFSVLGITGYGLYGIILLLLGEYKDFKALLAKKKKAP